MYQESGKSMIHMGGTYVTGVKDVDIFKPPAVEGPQTRKANWVENVQPRPW